MADDLKWALELEDETAFAVTLTERRQAVWTLLKARIEMESLNIGSRTNLLHGIHLAAHCKGRRWRCGHE